MITRLIRFPFILPYSQSSSCYFFPLNAHPERDGLTLHIVQSPLKFSQILSHLSPTGALPLAWLYLHCPLEGQPFPCTRILPPTMHQSNSHSSLVYLKAYVPLGACCCCPGCTHPRFLSAPGPSCRLNKVALTTCLYWFNMHASSSP